MKKDGLDMTLMNSDRHNLSVLEQQFNTGRHRKNQSFLTQGHMKKRTVMSPKVSDDELAGVGSYLVDFVKRNTSLTSQVKNP